MSETLNRFFVTLFMIAVLFGALWLEKVGLHGIYGLCVVVGAGMILEFLACLWRAPRDVMFNGKNLLIFAAFLGLLIVDFSALRFLGTKIMTLLLLLMVICAADIGAWFFGRLLGGDKMWEKVSENKTWTGQVFGIICGTAAAVAYGYIARHTYMPQMIWLGIGISLLSQYGDLTASFVKRKLGIKDFSHILGKHGGILDRFDGWIYVLPLVWLMIA